MSAPQSPLGSRRRLGAELRRLRTRSRLTLDDVAEHLTCSTSKISRLETGKGIPKLPDVRELMRIYGVTSDTESEMLVRLVHDGREHGWWEPVVEGLPPDLLVDPSIRHAGLETDALRVTAFELTLVHALLRTPDYSREVLRTTGSVRDPSETERLVELRRRRQEAVTRADSPLQLRVVLDEAVLHRPIGSASTMAAQLAHLLDLARLPNVEVRVLPFSAGVRRGHAGPFGVLEFPPDFGTDVAYLKGHAGFVHVEGELDVERYLALLRDLTSVSYDDETSLSTIDRRRAAYLSA